MRLLQSENMLGLFIRVPAWPSCPLPCPPVDTALHQALHRERAGVVANREAALRRGDAREKIPSPFVRGDYIEGELTGYEAARRLERQLGDIDAEVARVGGGTSGSATVPSGTLA
jgi:hypothetical protein